MLPGQNPLITNPGLLFTLGDGTEVNIFSNGPSLGSPNGTYTFYENNGFNINGTFTLTAVPEPATLVMSGMAGLVGLGIVGIRRRKVSASA